MAELMVIYDPELQLAAIVDVDNRCGWGPAMAGENAGQILDAWVNSIPGTVSVVSHYDAVRLFKSFLDATGATDADTSAQDESLARRDEEDRAAFAADALATAEAHHNTDVPQAQPADTDMEAHASAPDQVMRCVNCNGAGTINFGDDMPTQQCNMCKGTGKITVGAP